MFLTGHPIDASALLHNIKHTRSFEQNVIMNVSVEDTPRVSDQTAYRSSGSPTLSDVTLRFGFMEEPNLHALAGARARGLTIDVMRTSFFLSRRGAAAREIRLPRWQGKSCSFGSLNLPTTRASISASRAAAQSGGDADAI